MVSPPDFPCSLVIDIPLPTHRLASIALQALQVDAELSPLVHRQLSLAVPDDTHTAAPAPADTAVPVSVNGAEDATILHTEYRASTNRMLRVAVNGFFESLALVLQVMEELDVDVLAAGQQQQQRQQQQQQQQ